MRVSANSFSDTLITQLGNLAVRQTRLQSQAATGQRVRLPEDDPVSLRRVLDLNSEFRSTGQYSRNIARQLELAQASFSGIKGIKPIRANAAMYMMVKLDLNVFKDIDDDVEFCQKLLHD